MSCFLLHALCTTFLTAQSGYNQACILNEGNVVVFQRRLLNKAFRPTGTSCPQTLTTGQKTEVPAVTLCLGQSHIQTAYLKFLSASTVSRGCCKTLVFHFQYVKKRKFYYYYIFILTIIILLNVYYKSFVTVFSPVFSFVVFLFSQFFLYLTLRLICQHILIKINHYFYFIRTSLCFQRQKCLQLYILTMIRHIWYPSLAGITILSLFNIRPLSDEWHNFHKCCQAWNNFL